MTTPREIQVDCYGHPSNESLVIQCEDAKVNFVFDDSKTADQRFHLGLYLDYMATSGRCYLRYPRARRIAVLCEPGASRAFVEQSRLARRYPWILTHDRRLLERGVPYVEFPFGTSWVSSVLDRTEPFKKSKLVSSIGAPHQDSSGGGHVLRNAVVENLVNRSDVDCFGRGIRWIESKLEGLADYAFSIAIENCARDYYFTEKIIDCFLTDTVPIYWGCAGIGRYFDTRGMIRFATLDELLAILPTLNFARYQEFVPYARANKQKAIENGWASRPGLFSRVAQVMAANYAPTRPASVRAWVVRQLEWASRHASRRCCRSL